MHSRRIEREYLGAVGQKQERSCTGGSLKKQFPNSGNSPLDLGATTLKFWGSEVAVPENTAVSGREIFNHIWR